MYELPLLKRFVFHKRIGINLLRPALLSLVGAVLALLIMLGEAFMLEHDMRLVREDEVRSLILHQMRPAMGAPGTIPSDYTEGTINLQVRNPGQVKSR